MRSTRSAPLIFALPLRRHGSGAAPLDRVDESRNVRQPGRKTAPSLPCWRSAARPTAKVTLRSPSPRSSSRSLHLWWSSCLGRRHLLDGITKKTTRVETEGAAIGQVQWDSPTMVRLPTRHDQTGASPIASKPLPPEPPRPLAKSRRRRHGHERPHQEDHPSLLAPPRRRAAPSPSRRSWLPAPRHSCTVSSPDGLDRKRIRRRRSPRSHPGRAADCCAGWGLRD